MSATSQKLCEWITGCILPSNIVIPVTLGQYNGTTDPDDFLQIFEGVMKTQHWSDEVACHLFPTVLQSAAREWFAKLPPNGITCFADLREKFLIQYQNLRQHTYTHLYAHEIPMYPGEKIESFITRYMMECQKIPGLPKTQHIFGFITCLDKDTHPSLVSELRWNIPSTFADVVTVARQYQHLGRERQAGITGMKKKEKRKGEATAGTVMTAVDAVKAITRATTATAKAMTTIEKRNGQKSDKYCEFHEDNDHETNECKALIREIIAKIKAGELNHLLSGRKFKKPDPYKTFSWQKEDGKKHEKAKDKAVINMINIEKDEFALQSSWKDVTVTFPGLPARHSRDELVVITGLIDGFPVSEMYTDTGSKVEVLYAHCLSKLPKSVGRRMRQSNAVISGFMGFAEEPIGRIKAAITFGAIASTTHGILKLPTRRGVATVQSTRHPFPRNECTRDRQCAESWKTSHAMEEKCISVLKRLSFFSPSAHFNCTNPVIISKAEKAVAGWRRRPGCEKPFNGVNKKAEPFNPTPKHSRTESCESSNRDKTTVEGNKSG
ncbi:uncharacterized protein [Rutidosis leptorrhynchoides]|uniref:uncharacterized protein n=1 Tax=Rutidosis leptorrhynchoides TaxID=125765 RepID=UPI003A99A713